MIELVSSSRELIHDRTAAVQDNNGVSRDLCKVEGSKDYQAVMKGFATEAQKARAGQICERFVAFIPYPGFPVLISAALKSTGKKLHARKQGIPGGPSCMTSFDPFSASPTLRWIPP